MCSKDRYVEHFPSQYIGSADASADDSGSSAIKTCIRPLCPAKAEFHDAVSSRGMYHAGSFGGDQALMVDNRQDGGFYKLGFHDRRNDFDQRLSRKDFASFRDCVDITAEMIST